MLVVRAKFISGSKMLLIGGGSKTKYTQLSSTLFVTENNV